jgi:hypothetical protein
MQQEVKLIPTLGRIIGGAANVVGSVFGRPAVEAPQITNIQTVGETQDSGSENSGGQMMQANPLAAFGPQIAQGISRNLPAIGRALGIGGGAVLGSQFLGGQNGEICESPQQKPFNVNKMTGCITITRRQQMALKDALKFTDIPTLAASIGLDPMQLCQLLLKRFKARGRGITAASMKTTKRTIRQIKSLHNEVSSMAGRKTPVRRTAAVKQVKYSN